MRAQEKKGIYQAGLFMLAMLAILMVFIILIGKENALFSEKKIYKAHVKNAKNLKPGAFIQLNGLKVGQVNDVSILSQDTVEIKLSIREEFAKWIKKDSTISIETAGLVGDKFLEIKDGSTGAPNATTSDILEGSADSSLEKIVGQGEGVLEKVESVLVQLNGILSQMGTEQRISKTLTNVQGSSKKLENLLKKIPAASLSSSLKKLETTTKRLDAISARIEQGPGTLHSLIYDQSLYQELEGLLGGAKRNKIIRYFIRESIESSKKDTTVP